MDLDTRKGYLFAFISLFCGASVYIISKSILLEIEIKKFMMYWFGIASFNITIVLIFFKRENTPFSGLFDEVKRSPIFYLYILSTELGAALLFFYLVKRMNPSVISFIENLNPLFVVAISILFLKEKMNLIEFSGGFISLLGVLLLTFSYVNGKFLYISLSVFDIFIYALNSTVIRHFRNSIDPFKLASLRIYTIFSFFLIYNFLNGYKLSLPSIHNITLLLLGATLGPFIGMYSYFKSLHHLKASNVSFINRIKPFLVFLGSSVILNIEMSKKSLLSGILIVIGTSILIYGSSKRKPYEVTE